MENSFHGSQEELPVLTKSTNNKLLIPEKRLMNLVDMQIKVQSLLIKRNHLREELLAIDQHLTSLDREISNQEIYKQLSFCFL